jgi:hypothetical protein
MAVAAAIEPPTCSHEGGGGHARGVHHRGEPKQGQAPTHLSEEGTGSARCSWRPRSKDARRVPKGIVQHRSMATLPARAVFTKIYHLCCRTAPPAAAATANTRATWPSGSRDNTAPGLDTALVELAVTKHNGPVRSGVEAEAQAVECPVELVTQDLECDVNLRQGARGRSANEINEKAGDTLLPQLWLTLDLNDARAA